MRGFLLFSLMLSSQAFSGEVKVLSGGAAKSLVDPLAASLGSEAPSRLAQAGYTSPE